MANTALHYFPVNVGDWLREPVRDCSLLARALYMEFCLQAHDCTPYGYLARNGEPLPDDTILSRIGGKKIVPLRQVLRLRAELVAAGAVGFDGRCYFVPYLVNLARDRASSNRKEKHEIRTELAQKQFDFGSDPPCDKNCSSETLSKTGIKVSPSPSCQFQLTTKVKTGPPNALAAVATGILGHALKGSEGCFTNKNNWELLTETLEVFGFSPADALRFTDSAQLYKNEGQENLLSMLGACLQSVNDRRRRPDTVRDIVGYALNKHACKFRVSQKTEDAAWEAFKRVRDGKEFLRPKVETAEHVTHQS